MSGKSVSSGSVISLPQGGGALQGIGETFSPDLHTGTANFNIPIGLPPGRNGFQPQLSLAYSSGNGNGPYGLGWSAGIPNVSRKTSLRIPRYDDNSLNAGDWDTFLLSASEDLVPVPAAADGARRYRPRTESLFASIEHRQDQPEDYWIVKTKDGLVSYYGRDQAVIRDSSQTDGTGPRRIFLWSLSSTTDLFGNTIEYVYETDLGQNQIYLCEIRYADYGVRPGAQFLIRVRLTYDDRPDHFSFYRAGFEICTRRRCSRIEVFTHNQREQLIRTYQLTYLDQETRPATPMPLNAVSLLSRIDVRGHDGGDSEALPPLEFRYTQFEPQKRKFTAVKGADMPPSSLAHSDYELVDLLGNGLPDIFEMNGSVRYWRNLGNGVYDRPRNMDDAPAGYRLANGNVQLIDADGDGRADLLISGETQSGYFPLRFDGQWDRNSFQPYAAAPSFGLKDPEVRLLDLDGDGVTDALRSGTRFECFFNDRKTGWTSGNTRWMERRALTEFPNVDFTDPRVKWADMTGGGMQDIALVHDGAVEYWPNLGYGNWGRRVSMRHCPRFPYGFEPKRILVGDVDGDGLADIVYVDDRSVTLWINQSGKGWSDPIVIRGTPPVSDMDAVRLTDLLGTGTSGILWTTDLRTPGRDSMFFLDFTGSVKPYLLEEMDNHTGAVTRVTYSPSTRFYLNDQKRPQTRWKTTLPFPVQVVERVEVIDAISGGKLTSEFRYHHGHWDGAEREFRGFGRVDRRDSETLTSPGNTTPEHFAPPLETRTWFDQGPVGSEFGAWTSLDFTNEFWTGDSTLLFRPASMESFIDSLPRRVKRDALRTLRGRVLRTETYALDGSIVQDRPTIVTEHLSGICAVVDDAGLPQLSFSDFGQRIFFPHSLAKRTTNWDRGDDPLTQIDFTGGYNFCGQPQSTTTVALPRRKAKRVPVTGAATGMIDANESRILATHTHTDYAAPDTGLYLYDRAGQTRSFELTAPSGLTESDPNQVDEVLKNQAAAAQGIDALFRQILGSWAAGSALPSELRLISHSMNHYDGDAFAGRAAGEVGPFGALTRSASLAFTNAHLDSAFADSASPSGTRRPIYLGGNAALPRGTPAGLGDNHGFRFEADSAAGYHQGYYLDTKRVQFDFQDPRSSERRGFTVAVQDALGNQTSITPDVYWLLPQTVIDPAEMRTHAVYNYRVMQPAEVTDPNGNSTHFRYSPLGLLQKQFLVSNTGEGGTEDRPEMESTYDFFAYDRTQDQTEPQPIFVHARRRINHASAAISDETIETRSYFDGFGRQIQQRAQAEELIFGDAGDDVALPRNPGDSPGRLTGRRSKDRVVVSGWQKYDNKGRTVEQYEPFFSDGWDYQPEADAKKGPHLTFYYDAVGRVVRTVHPDGSEERVVFGIPAALDNPADYAPTPWESFVYDSNDLAPLSSNPASTPASHYYTPVSTITDAFNRVICQVVRNGTNPLTDWFITRSAYDIRGNLIGITDRLNRVAFNNAYDLLNHLLRIESIDGGLRTSVSNAMGSLIEFRDSKGSIALREYDNLNRLTRLWARNDPTASVTLRERLIYGDDSSNSGMATTPAQQKNLLGKVFRYYDEAGVQTIAGYDFKGNPIEKTRQVVSDADLSSVDNWIADWSARDRETVLDSTIYQTDTTYDALNRITRILHPEDVNGARAAVVPHYNRAGGIDNVEVDRRTLVELVAYNAKGQRVVIQYGNQVMTRYSYQRENSRLLRLRTGRYTEPSAGSFEGSGNPIQDLTYAYDAVGNITSIEDNSPGSGIANTPAGRDRLARQFAYDALYRLSRANGRSCKAAAGPRPIIDPRCLSNPAQCGVFPAPYSPGPPVPDQNNAPDLTEAYTQTYQYDPAGNLLWLRHTASTTAWVKEFGLDTATNRLMSLNQNGDTYSFGHDSNGNLFRQNTERRYTWDHADRMVAYSNQADCSTHRSVDARYLYGGDGLRVKKWVRNNGAGTGESTVYIEGVFEHYRNNASGFANNHLHLNDGAQRIALLRRGHPHPDDAGPPVQYHLGDHLGSSSIVIDDRGTWINREEYFPHGETSFGSFARKRYRCTGRERDEESGLHYHGARYYASWLMRWISCDPAGPADGVNAYLYVQNNPLALIDPGGCEGDSPPNIQVGLQPPTKEQLQQANEARGTDDLAWAKNQAAMGNDPATGQPMVKVHPDPKGWDEKIAEGYVHAFSLALNLGVALLEPLGWMGVGMTEAEIAEARTVLTAAEIDAASVGGTALPKSLPPPKELSVLHGEFDAGNTPSPALARTVEELQNQGVRIRGNFVNVAPDDALYGEVQKAGGAYVDGSTIYVNMDILKAERNVLDRELGVPLNERQTLLHEMGHLGEDKNTILPLQKPYLNRAKAFANEAEASRKAALMAVDPEDQRVLITHSIAAVKATAQYLSR